jgi:hypothetical protein
MAKRKKNRKPTIKQLQDKLENWQERDDFLLARALGRFNGQPLSKRNKKRSKDQRNHWMREWEDENADD